MPVVRSLFRTPALTAFMALIAFAIILNWVAWKPDSYAVQRWIRGFGYAAFLMLLVAYAYWPRRWFLDRRWFRMKNWLLVHIAASCAALGLTLVHSLGQVGDQITFWIMLLFWIVMASGLAGFFGQKICYRMLSLIVTTERGPAELEKERKRLRCLACKVIKNRSASVASGQRFLGKAQEYVESDWKPLSWLFSREVYEPVSFNMYEHARKLADEQAGKDIQQLWSCVQQRREIDIEHLFHRVARCWLMWHRVAAAVLFLLVIAHVVSSIRMGGW